MARMSEILSLIGDDGCRRDDLTRPERETVFTAGLARLAGTDSSRVILTTAGRKAYRLNPRTLIPAGWKLEDVYGDGDLVFTNGEHTAWIEDGDLHIGDSEGANSRSIPIGLLFPMAEFWA